MYSLENIEKAYNQAGFKNFVEDFKSYEQLSPFKISENVEVTKQDFNEGSHFIMRTISEFYLTKVFESMKIDMNDDNVGGDKGTPYRIIKTWTGANLEDDSELMSGRWSNKPRIATFPNESINKFPITKRVDIVSLCSHHSAPFSTLFSQDSYAIVSYIPSKKVLGISKLQRLVSWVSRRGHLQENLTKMIYEEVSKAAETESVYVGLFNLKHTCEFIRGAQSCDGAFTSEYYGGDFGNDDIRKGIKQ